MLERFYESPWHLRHLRREPLAEQMDQFAGRLYRLGFTQKSGQRILRLTGRLNDFARSVRIQSAEQIDESLITRFIQEDLPRHGIFKDAPVIMRHLQDYLCDQGMLQREICTGLDRPFDNILRNYDQYLSHVRGLVPTSCSHYLRYARRFLDWLQSHCGDKPLERMNGPDILEFISEFARRHASAAWRNNLCSLTRVFLRYLRWEGIISSDLERAVPKLPGWRLASIPWPIPAW